MNAYPVPSVGVLPVFALKSLLRTTQGRKIERPHQGINNLQRPPLNMVLDLWALYKQGLGTQHTLSTDIESQTCTQHRKLINKIRLCAVACCLFRGGVGCRQQGAVDNGPFDKENMAMSPSLDAGQFRMPL
ncbi:unnamed protein product [Pleuronectes platessa]|uniref:Uncharacterized protein n=1 Tax=Pleuronectes platessa TaxID=8262 RepID=A0A9N7VC05_PLEPL|nr:unnamed protein product [Pleuronectes platessa]